MADIIFEDINPLDSGREARRKIKDNFDKVPTIIQIVDDKKANNVFEVLTSESVINPALTKATINGLFVDLLLGRGSSVFEYAPTQIKNNVGGVYQILIFSLNPDGTFKDNILSLTKGTGQIVGGNEIFKGTTGNYFSRYEAVINWSVLNGITEGTITTVSNIRFNSIFYQDHYGYIQQSDLITSTNANTQALAGKADKVKVLSANSTIAGNERKAREAIIIDAQFSRGSLMTSNDYLQLTSIRKNVNSVDMVQIYTATAGGAFITNVLNLVHNTGVKLGDYEYFDGVVGSIFTYKVLVDWSALSLLSDGTNTVGSGHRFSDLLMIEHIGAVYDIETRRKAESRGVRQIENLSQIVHFLGYGQSLMAGTNATPVVPGLPRYSNVFKFNGGVRTIDMLGLLAQYRKTYITRNSAPSYGELINAATKLSVFDNQQLDIAYNSLVPIAEISPSYAATNTATGAPKVGFKFDPAGIYKGVHNNGETPMTGFSERFNAQMIDKFACKDIDLNFKIIASAPSYGSATFLSLMPLDKGGTIHVDLDTTPTGDGSNLNYFELLIKDVTEGKKYADSVGAKYTVPALLYIHESTDIYNTAGVTTPVNARRILQLFTLINSRVRRITGQTNDIVFLTHQSSLGQAQANAQYFIVSSVGAVDDVLTPEQKTLIKTLPNYEVLPYPMDNVILGAPSYAYEFVDGDFVHHTAIAQRIIGETSALMYNKHRTGKAKTMPISPNGYRAINNGNGTFSIYLKMHVPVMPLVLDANAVHGSTKNPTCVARGDKFGFVFSTDGASAHVNIITAVEVIEGDTIKITTNQTPQDKYLQYAYILTTHPDWGGKVSQWGNVRDSQGIANTSTINGITYPLHNWSAGYQIKISL